MKGRMMTQKEKQSRILVVGLGAIGQVFACHLKASGCIVFGNDIKQDCVEAIRKNGITIEGIASLHANLDGVATNLDELAEHKFDYIVICVKTPYLKSVASALKNFKNGYSVVSMQNGIDTEELLGDSFDRKKIMRIVINFAGNMISPGKIKMTFFHKPNHVGCLCSEENCGQAKRLADLITAAGLETEPTNEIQKLAWRKTILVASLAPIASLLGMTMLEVMTMDETRCLVRMLLEEAIEVARAMNYDFGEDFYNYCINYLTKAGDHKPSMLVDVELGNPTEIDYINAKISQHGKALNLPVSLNTYLTMLVKAKEKLEMRKRKIS
jgi:2-dehydropantoate 2-reductase